MTRTTYPPVVVADAVADELAKALVRYQGGEPRKTVFRDLVRDSIRLFPSKSTTVLDIGCGHGFERDGDLQRSLADEADRFIGIEPDKDMPPPACFTEIHSCLFEEAPLEQGTVQVAYSSFVLEHVENPELFWRKLHECLVPGGIFWGFTVDARHFFSAASQTAGRLRFKDKYLDWLRGRRGVDRYENYRTFYRANTPAQVRRHTGAFRRADYLSLHRVGQLNYYFPRLLWPALHCTERLFMKLCLPGSILIIRLEK